MHLGTNFCISKSDRTKFLHESSPDATVEKLDAFLAGKTSVNRGILRETMLKEIFKYENAKIEWNAKFTQAN
jgi:hypothetical protein